MPQDYWTCSECGANLDFGERCDCGGAVPVCGSDPDDADEDDAP